MGLLPRTAFIVLVFGLAILGLALGAASVSAQSSAVKPSAKSLQALKEAQKKQAAAKSAFLRNTRDAKAKKAYILATNSLAKTTMDSPALTSKEKYPSALRLYREVLKADPKNSEATGWIKQIEAIYRSLGKPIPK